MKLADHMPLVENASEKVVLYHAQCLDGFGAAFSMWKAFGTNARYIPMEYGKDKPEDLDICPGAAIWIVDYSIPPELFASWTEIHTLVCMLDHHKTAFEAYECSHQERAELHYGPRGFVVLDNDHSGAYLAAEYVSSHVWKYAIPDLVRHIEDRDLWKFELSGTEAITLALSMHPKDFWEWDMLVLNVSQLQIEGKLLLKYRDHLIDRCLENTYRTVIDGQEVPVVNSPMFQSEIGNRLAQDEPFAGVWYRTQDGKIKWSLRSNKKNPEAADVSTIAKKRGGGGHQTAAGFVLFIIQDQLGTQWDFMPMPKDS